MQRKDGQNQQEKYSDIHASKRDYFTNTLEMVIIKKKLSPEQMAKLLRKDLTPEEYVSVQQIRSLFSRGSKQYREGALKEPSEDINNGDPDSEDPEDEEENNAEEIDEKEYGDELEEVLENQTSNVLKEFS